MRFSEVFAVSLVVPLVAAHGNHIPGAPKIFGLNPIGKLKSRNVFNGHVARSALPQQAPGLKARQGGVGGRCGAAAGGASCDSGYCCSSAGWCGIGADYCQAPDCQINFGPGCDANKTPGGSNTSSVARTKLGSVVYGGAGIYACTVPGTVAITYDDGPYTYTDGVLDQFKAYNARATFFITGININKGAIDNAATPWPAVIRRMIADGHQVASHTWSHQDLSAITTAQRHDQMIKNEMAIRNIIGKFPTYMRPPYSSCTPQSGCQDDLNALGYHISYFDLDTDDYNNVTPDKIQNAKNNFNAKIGPSNPATKDWLAIAHDIHQQTAQNLTGYMLATLTAKGYRAVTMGECLGDPEANWYRDSAGSVFTSSAISSTPTASATATSSKAIVSPTAVSRNGSCGGVTGFTCVGFADGQCCSQYGWCGATPDHCNVGCQSAFGNCAGDGSSSIITAASSSVPATSTFSSIPSSTPTGRTSPDGTCGGTSGYHCIGFSLGSCCSQYGWCGASSGHCGSGCNPKFGTCGTSLKQRGFVQRW
ncbi:glycoside hydrolase/deacetylase [Lindgomyces ingoldianus]|uniref:Glycoside hydrolase/deacetylase n=1 Tax=Lindgomyces ingoldianus TaxID=673940 RepID=A0ACB6QYG5_9PLEO|nr:glycoside hydrolase/deacetylase [Lindgomyces ingoldianus]KAF2471961.1 glycoside hydrolase/deacetylase [Lindgomyces ingoldianus]